MPFTEQLAGAGLGLLLGAYDDKRQLEQQGKLMQQQMQGQAHMAEVNRQIAMKMWEDTNYSAQVKQLEKAGLSVGLMYGKGGAGGATTQSNPGNVSSGQAQQNPGEAGLGIQLAAQLGLMQAQKENIQADTALKNKEAGVKDVTIPNIQANTEAILTNIKTEKMKQVMQGYNNEMARIQTEINTITAQEIVNTIIAHAKKIEAEAVSAKARGEIDDATKDEVITQAGQMVQKNILEMTALKAGIKLTNEQTTKLGVEMQNIRREYELKKDHMTAEQKQTWIQEQRLQLEKTMQEFKTSTPAQLQQWTSALLPIILGSMGGAGGSAVPIGFQFGPKD